MSDDAWAVTAPPPARGAAGLAPGTVLAGRYAIERELGQGGMGIVYAARDAVLGRPVAVKVLRPELRSNEALITRFLNEARIVASLFTNPNIVNIYDLGRTPDGDPYLVMELLRGKSLRDSIDPASPMRPSRSWVLELVGQIASALGDAHSSGVAHRDLKPENVFVLDTHMRLVKVLDFGLAVSASAPLASAFRTQPGALIGTPAYMAPEAIRGEEVGAPADLYALGVMLHELATGGQMPYTASTLGQWMRAHELDAPLPLPTELARAYPGAFAALLAEMLAKDPAARPSAWEAYRRLNAVSEEIEASRKR